MPDTARDDEGQAAYPAYPEGYRNDRQGPDRCPACGSMLVGDPIPQEYIDKGYYGDPNGDHSTHYLRVIGQYDIGTDRTTAWQCPDCGHVWPR